jgi:hypothetical protein
LQEAKKEYIIAILFAPSWDPANKKFFLPRARLDNPVAIVPPIPVI